jgi:predicted metal-dependent HD superfamily phosphohydrolase
VNEDLHERLTALLRRVCRRPTGCDDAARQLFALYQEPIRHYHNLEHIRHCLGQFDAFQTFSQDPDALEAAIWFHDAVYDPSRNDNEAKSAELARKVLIACGAPDDFARRVADLIMVTLHDGPPQTVDGRLMADIDLSGLGQDPQHFDRDGRSIRQEYAHISQDQFDPGRANLLQRFLDRPHVYYTPAFRDRYEKQARANLLRAIGPVNPA